MVAHDRKIRMKKEESLQKATASAAASTGGNAKDAAAQKLARRKSTKVWGRKIEEVTAAEADLLHSAKADSSEKERDEREWSKYSARTDSARYMPLMLTILLSMSQQSLLSNGSREN